MKDMVALWLRLGATDQKVHMWVRISKPAWLCPRARPLTFRCSVVSCLNCKLQVNCYKFYSQVLQSTATDFLMDKHMLIQRDKDEGLLPSCLRELAHLHTCFRSWLYVMVSWWSGEFPSLQRASIQSNKEKINTTSTTLCPYEFQQSCGELS